MRLFRCAQASCLLLLCLVSSALHADYTLNMTKGVTAISRNIHQLHMTIFWICVGVGLLVFSVMFYAILWHRQSRGVTAANFHENTTIEIIWTIIPFVILVAMAIPATQLLIKMADTKTDSDISIKITGHQWRWEYEYLGEGLRFISNLSTPQAQIKNRDIKNKYYLLEVDNPLVVPIGKKIRLLTTAGDVIHSWWVPDLGIKKDAIPGFINEAWTKIEVPGTYRGQCAELCGVNHGYMPIVVEAKTEAEYQQWLAEKKKEYSKEKPEPAASPSPSPSPEPAANHAPESTPTPNTSETPAPALDSQIPSEHSITQIPANNTDEPTSNSIPNSVTQKIKLKPSLPPSSTSTEETPSSKPTHTKAKP